MEDLAVLEIEKNIARHYSIFWWDKEILACHLFFWTATDLNI